MVYVAGGSGPRPPVAAAKMLDGAAVIPRLDWAWRLCFQDGSFSYGCWQEASIGLLECRHMAAGFP